MLVRKIWKSLKLWRFELVQPFGQPQTIHDTERCVADLQKQGDAKEWAKDVIEELEKLLLLV